MTEGSAIATLDAWRARGGDRLDPVRFRFIEAFAARSAAYQGAARQVLDDKLAGLLAAYEADLDKVPAAAHGSTRRAAPAPTAAARRGALAELVDYIGQHALPREDDAASGSAPELRAVSQFRASWTRLDAQRRLTQSLAKVPENAGPLNSHHLVHRSLSLMQELSPEYLHRFTSYVDALFWLDQAGSSGKLPARGLSKAGPST